MTDYTELKRLAEAAPAGPWYQHGGIKQVVNHDCETVCETFEEDGDCPAAKFIAAANPAAVQALIAENERVKARLCVCRDCAGQGEIYSGRHSHHGYNQPPEPVMHVCGTCDGDGVLGPLEDFESLAAERDQLKAENAAQRLEKMEKAHG
ncbi:hypothetical protein [Pseudomonas sp. MWU12-2345]|uniref:hypothetical protein n=1 Tax=Pseudomonas sp. MWU12-2345 TaxID=2928689 RepID=UPI002010B92D|nr:hypothetical protein [Pseudomonas sp. MWU12-2345]